jgi:psp operon transcriptional activator
MKTSKFIKRQSQAALVEKYRMIGESEPFLDTMEQVSNAARVNRPVLIIGERGTGKELVAARLHYLSPRWQYPKIAINCAAFTPSLLESEIFGYEPGAFTGAVKIKKGRFELAHGGSLFLDELAQSPMALQEKILRVLEYQEFERVGGTDTISVDVRVIAATNQDLPGLCRRGKFREDLLDRLSFEVVTLPPLRERREDIPLLVATFARKMTLELGLGKATRFSEGAMQSLMEYHWPGNIRELKNVVERTTYRAQEEMVREIVFDPFDSPYRPGETRAPVPEKPKEQPHENAEHEAEQPRESEADNLPAAVEALERRMVMRALEEHQYNQKRASETLGISYYQLRRILKRLDLP